MIGHNPFFTNYKTFLRELYRIQVSNNTDLPLERIICHFVDSLYFQNERVVCYPLAGQELKFYRQPIYGAEWDTNDDCLESTFVKISIDNLILIWEGLLLERKVFLVSQSKTILTNTCMALTSLLFPFQWIHVLIPILPEKLKVFTDAPVPLLIGICYKLDLSDFPADSIVFNIDKSSFEKYLDKLPKLPQKLHQNMLKRLDKYKNKFNNTSDQERLQFIDEVFNYSESDNGNNFNSQEVRDIFFEFFITMFKNYEKYFGFKNRKTKDGKLEQLVFNKEAFLKDHSSLEPGSFLYKFTETNIFAVFEDGFKYFEQNYLLQFFIDSIKKEKKKDKYYLPYIIPTLSSTVPEINTKDISNNKTYQYKYFPKLNSELYVKIDVPKPQYQSKFEISRDEWCFDVTKLHARDWCKFQIYIIYEIWYQFFSIIIPTFDDKRASCLIDHAIFILNELFKKKITPSRSLYTKLIRACARSSLSSKVNLIFSTMPQNYRQNNPLYYNAFMNGLYDGDIKMDETSSTSNSFSNNGSSSNLNRDNSKQKLMPRLSFLNLRSSIFMNNDHITNSNNVQELLESSIFLNYEYCPNCYKSKKLKKMSIEEVLGGFKREKNTYYSVCGVCLSKIYPKIYILYDNQTSLDHLDTVPLLSPMVLLKEVDTLIKNNGEKYFFLSDYYRMKEHRTIFWNIALYFQLLNLPLFTMSIQRHEARLNTLIEDLDKIRNNINNNNKKILGIGIGLINSTRTNTLSSDLQSRKNSSASNDHYSVFSTPTIKSSNLHSYDKTLHQKILEKVEMYSNGEIEKTNEDKTEIMNNVYEIRQVLNIFFNY